MGLLGIWDIGDDAGDVECSGSGMLGMWNVGDMRFSRCGMLGGVGFCGCGMFRT